MNPNFKRTAGLIGLVAAGSLVLSACSEDTSNGGDDKSASDLNLSGTSGQLTGEGASSQQKAMDLFNQLYSENVDGAALSYNASGSGAGVKQFTAGTVAFGGSDSPLKDEEVEPAAKRCGGNEAWHLPMVIGPVAIAYNLEGVDKLALTPEVIAEIFDGKIKKWDDEAIKKLNEGVELPSENITVVHRSDESGTTDNFQKFLKASAGDAWPHEPSKVFPGAGSGASGSSGVADQVAATKNSITYVESGFATEKDLGVAEIDFGNGPVALNADSVGVALENLKYKTPEDSHNMVIDSKALFAMDTEGAYPLVLTTYEIVCSAGYDETTRDMVKDFLTIALEKGQTDKLSELGFIPVKGAYKDKLVAAVDAIK
ncbi:phosphate ABC transporter substrate-binding protein PstS [Corynebacterium ulceribovis]|uniref:phosphate ABC transporter substrate-binding protein PstS n=1 Tax=Corynebacterium ulceribovis TaxID=487732 RepID=UPI00035D2248|nr:phosphate ABC transporter substrate-binding protein PstS [Corynebacterium ulceribovis]